MFSNKERFKKGYLKKLESLCGKGIEESTIRDQYHTLGNMVREYISTKWIETNELYRSENKKQVYYLSIEFLLGRLLGQNLLNLEIKEVVEEGLHDLGISLSEIEECESDPALGNGGLGRLAACFIDSLATLNLPGHGYGIRYKHGLFDQKIVDGYQVELPEQWLRHGNVWEVRKPEEAIKVFFWGRVETSYDNNALSFKHVGAQKVLAVPYDMPVIGYQVDTVNTLRLWNAEPSSLGPNQDTLSYKREIEAITDYLYPDDTHDEGKILRLKQQYFLVSSSIQSIIASFKKENQNLRELHHSVAIHINDTHPAMAVPELMRILMDIEGLTWDEAWEVTTNTLSYTNHTILSEALEKWPIYLFQPLLPRIYMIIEEINERFCAELWDHYPGEWERIEHMAIIAHGLVKMAHLAIVGSNSINGVAKIHSDILKNREMKSFYDIYPWKFNNKTNGITHRRWLLKANPELTSLITEVIGDEWKRQPEKLLDLKRHIYHPELKERFAAVKRKRKEILAKEIADKNGIIVDIDSIFDVQVKRLHAYKRQLLNVLHIMYLYNRIKEDANYSIQPRTFIFGAKASPTYYYAKKVIKLIHSLADKVNNDPRVSQVIKVIFMGNYRVSLAEDIFPAADVSEQISTASKEASGTGNMKFMMNGALTVGTLDGANIEIMEEVGRENIFTFGLTAGEVQRYEENGRYRSMEYYHHDLRIRQVVDQLTNGFFSEDEGEFESIADSLLVQNDQYFLLRDFASYIDVQERVGNAYQNRDKWLEQALINISHSGYFSSDRTIQQYADEIWKIGPVGIRI
ncbi:MULTISPECIES: glycogen/starch/alpha-glucan phosphorylase [Metabacillus]|uniref:Alpha-1,4 glucan phosphorylase n=1 Tax=Metabacillus rhizolycopersici TaxID=2875709 RepID=A0ABS7UU86_9BACI|nr:MULTISPECIES: glycogen/starch/alpha-glucan phosphorylase [Metabacillus]MBZ5751604.1 glycogen/starch/alpha-glucan phosphorylase [Metabacillus rhizolycopersici]MCM3650878.1 glycogen/starch/alpha-glucan phosphorylase [Metabacillus litoralis]